MKDWKITNISNVPIKFACKVPQGSKGVILKPGHFCVVENQATAFIEAQERRGFITVDRDFDNSKYNLEYGIALSPETVKILDDKENLKEAEKRAQKYIDKK